MITVLLPMSFIYSITQIRKRIKSNWIKTLRTAYLYELNDQVGGDFRKGKTELVTVKFLSLTRTNSRTRWIK